jgi:hypothetical protein
MFKSIFLQVLLPLSFSTDDSLLVKYKSDISYIVQEIVYGTDRYPFFAGLYRLKTDFDFFYISKEQDIINAIKTDTLNLNSLAILIPPNAGWCIYDSLSNQYIDRISYVQNIYDIMILDNTEVYKIGSKYYAVRKIKYAYLDNIELYRSLLFIKRDNFISEIHFENEDEERLAWKTYKTLREYLQIENYRYFLFLQELYETDKSIRKYVWKRKYELDEFWYKNVGEQKE